MTFLIQPFLEFEFMRFALAGGLLFALSSAWLGVLLCLKRLSLAGDAMSHSLLPGIGLSFAFLGRSSFNLFIGALASGSMVALMLAKLAPTQGDKADRRVGALLNFFTAIGLILLISQTGLPDLHEILFGSILSLGELEIAILSASSGLSLFLAFWFRKILILDIADPSYVQRNLSSWRWIRFLFFFLLALTLAAGIPAMGVMLVVGLLIIPAVSALEFSSNLTSVVLISFGITALSVFIGLIASYHWNLPASASILAVAGLIYICSLGLISFRKNHS